MSLPFSRMNSPNFLKLSSEEMSSSPFTIFVALCWNHSSKFRSLLYWKSQNWTQKSRCSFTNAGNNGSITSLDLLVLLCLMQPRVLLVYWLVLNLLSTRTLRSFFAELFSIWAGPSMSMFLPHLLSFLPFLIYFITYRVNILLVQ